MSKQVRIEFTQPPQGLTQVIQQAAGVVEAAANKVAARASSISPTGSTYGVHMRQIKLFGDAEHGTSRPAAIIETNGEQQYYEEAENKTLLKAVGKV